MKKYLYLLLFLLVSANKLYANNAAGGELYYEWIADSTYRFYFKYYSVCNASTVPVSVPLCFNNTCLNTNVSTTMSVLSGPTKNVPACSQRKNTCDSSASTIVGFNTTVYSALFTMPARCSTWRVFTYIANRANAVNIVSPTTQPMYIECLLNNTSTYAGNSSPYFTISNMTVFGVNQPGTYNAGAVDIDGDSIATDIITPRTGVTTCANSPTNVSFISTSPMISVPQNPFQTNNTFLMNARTGNMSFTPRTNGINTVCIRVREYRNGVLIGSIMREMPIYVMSVSITPPTTSVTNCSSTAAINFTYVCINQPLSLCIRAKSPSKGNKLYLNINNNTIAPGSTVNILNQGSDSVTATFLWTPTASDKGVKNFVITTTDSTCTSPGQVLTYVSNLQINVSGKPITSPKERTICPSEMVFIDAMGGSNYVWTVLPGGSTAPLACTTCASTNVRPDKTTTYVVESLGTAGCGDNKDTTVITVLPRLLSLSAKGDSAICIGSSVQLNAAGPGPFFWKILSGTPGSMSCVQCNNPIVRPFTTTKYMVESAVPMCNSITDTVTIQVLNKIIKYPSVNIHSDYIGIASRRVPVTFKANVFDCDSPEYQWVLDGNYPLLANSDTWIAYLKDSTANVHCIVTCKDPCVNTKIMQSNTIHLQVVNSVENISQSNGASIYPNPSSDGIFTISVNKQVSNTDLIVINSIGQTVHAEKGITIPAGSSRTLNLQQQPIGVYTIKLGDIPYRIIISK